MFKPLPTPASCVDQIELLGSAERNWGVCSSQLKVKCDDHFMDLQNLMKSDSFDRSDQSDVLWKESNRTDLN